MTHSLNQLSAPALITVSLITVRIPLIVDYCFRRYQCFPFQILAVTGQRSLLVGAVRPTGVGQGSLKASIRMDGS